MPGVVEFQKSRTFKANKSTRFLGVEVEIAYLNRNKYNVLEDVTRKWRGTLGADGSVMGRKKFKFSSPTNLELKTAPTNGDLFIKQMLEYGHAFKQVSCMTNDTCGLHVHMDARDLTDEDLDRVLLLWSKVEREMFSLVSPRRASSNWCHAWDFEPTLESVRSKLPIGQRYDYSTHSYVAPKVEDANKLLTNVKMGHIHPNRYSSLNLVALYAHGTLENRMHHGTTNVDNIINWALINASLIDFAKNNEMEKIRSLEKGWGTLMEVIDNDTVRGWATARKGYWEEFVRTAPDRAAAKQAAKEARKAKRKAEREAARNGNVQ